MTVAFQPLDPIAAAEADIRGSKSLMAAVADDLGRHERWLAHYRLAEKRHARRVMLQELIYQLELARRRTMRLLRRVSLLGLRLGRRVASFSARTAIFIFVTIRDAVIVCIDWLRPRAYALALLLRRWSIASGIWLAAKSLAFAALVARWGSAAWAWTRVNAVMLLRALWHWLARTSRRTRALAHVMARDFREGARIALSWSAIALRETALGLAFALKWTAVNIRLLARALRVEARRASSWGGAHARAAALDLHRHASKGAAWSAAKAEATARAAIAASHTSYAWSARNAEATLRAAIAASRTSYSWAALRLRQTANGRFNAAPPVSEPTHRALVVRRSTALICFEPRQAGRPALRAR